MSIEVLTKLSKFELHLLSKFKGRAMLDHDFFMDNPFSCEGAPDTKTVGYLPTKKMIFIANDLPKFRHEIAHMVEMKDVSRITKTDWGLPRYDLSKCSASKIVAAIARETRVIAIDGILRVDKALNTRDEDARLKGWGAHAILTSPDYVYKLSTNVRFIGALEEYNHLPYGRFWRTEDVVEWSDAIAERTVKAWSKDRIEAVWCERVEYILNWMESSAL